MKTKVGCPRRYRVFQEFRLNLDINHSEMIIFVSLLTTFEVSSIFDATGAVEKKYA